MFRALLALVVSFALGDFGGMWDPNGATSDFGSMWDPDG